MTDREEVRAAFEAWHRLNLDGHTYSRNNADAYVSSFVSRDWWVYLAAFEAGQQAAGKDAELDAVRYRKVRRMPFVLDMGRIAPVRPDKFDKLIDEAFTQEQRK